MIAEREPKTSIAWLLLLTWLPLQVLCEVCLSDTMDGLSTNISYANVTTPLNQSLQNAPYTACLKLDSGKVILQTASDAAWLLVLYKKNDVGWTAQNVSVSATLDLPTQGSVSVFDGQNSFIYGGVQNGGVVAKLYASANTPLQATNGIVEFTAVQVTLDASAVPRAYSAGSVVSLATGSDSFGKPIMANYIISHGGTISSDTSNSSATLSSIDLVSIKINAASNVIPCFAANSPFRRLHSATAYPGKINRMIIFGGIDHHNVLRNEVFFVDVAVGPNGCQASVTLIPNTPGDSPELQLSLPSPRYAHAVAVVLRTMCVSGGFVQVGPNVVPSFDMHCFSLDSFYWSKPKILSSVIDTSNPTALYGHCMLPASVVSASGTINSVNVFGGYFGMTNSMNMIHTKIVFSHVIQIVLKCVVSATSMLVETSLATDSVENSVRFSIPALNSIFYVQTLQYLGIDPSNSYYRPPCLVFALDHISFMNFTLVSLSRDIQRRIVDLEANMNNALTKQLNMQNAANIANLRESQIVQAQITVLKGLIQDGSNYDAAQQLLADVIAHQNAIIFEQSQNLQDAANTISGVTSFQNLITADVALLNDMAQNMTIDRLYLAQGLMTLGDNHGCVLSRIGIPRCWGRSTARQTTPSNVTRRWLSCGHRYCCAIGPGHKVDCWGSNTWFKSDPPTDFLAQYLTTGSNHACAVEKVTNYLRCWGANHHGQSKPPPQEAFLRVAAALQHTCGILANGSITCWGANPANELGSPVGIFRSLSCGMCFCCAIKLGNKVDCWGCNKVSQTAPPAGDFFLQIACGFDHCCGITTQGKTVCWGGNSMVMYSNFVELLCCMRFFDVYFNHKGWLKLL
jgi:hypothetical protein